MTSRLTVVTALMLVSPLLALDGQPGIHDPSTIVVHDGKYYTYGTGAGIDGTDRALAATAERELAAVPAFTGAPEQLWRIDRLTDGSYRLMPKAVPNASTPLALSAVGSSKPTLATFRPDGDRERWHFKNP